MSHHRKPATTRAEYEANQAARRKAQRQARAVAKVALWWASLPEGPHKLRPYPCGWLCEALGMGRLPLKTALEALGWRRGLRRWNAKQTEMVVWIPPNCTAPRRITRWTYPI